MNLSNIISNLSKKWLAFLIVAILFLFLNYNSETLIFNKEGDNSFELTDSLVLKEFEEMSSYRPSSESSGLYSVFGKENDIIGYFIFSVENRWNHSGYAGPIPIMIKLDTEKVVKEVLLLPNRETPRFLLKLYNKKFLKSWNGMSIESAARSDVDTVSGVTLTSRTIIANFSEFLEESEGFSPMGKIDYRQLIIGLSEMLLIIFALLIFLKKGLKRFRIILMALSIAVLGFIAGDFISMAMIRGFLTGAVPFRSNPLLWIIFISSFLIPAITNKSFYCAYICPFGAAQELAGHMTEKKFRLPRNLVKISKILRPALFGLLSLMIILDYKVDLSLVEPFAAFLYSVAAPITIAIAAVSLLLSLFFSKPWCRWFCPTGQLLEYFRSDI